MPRLITAEFVEAQAACGARRIHAPRGEVIVTPGAWSKAAELRIAIDQSGSSPSAVSPTSTAAPGSCERVVDSSGLVVVRGRSVRLGKFTGAGAGLNVGLVDLITNKDGAPMTAGIMSWSSVDSFPWTLDYDEVDLVLEGTLQLGIDGRVLEGGPGDIVYIPKGSRIHFGTPDRVRVFYVTYPADWAASGSIRPRE